MSWSSRSSLFTGRDLDVEHVSSCSIEFRGVGVADVSDFLDDSFLFRYPPRTELRKMKLITT